MHKLIAFLKEKYNRIITSIAFMPTIITILSVLVAALMIDLDFSETGRNIKSGTRWLRLEDASTARSILQAIAAGIISLTVFSFTMVMVVLNQAASNMSNRILDNLIGDKFQQTVLGIYIGTIVFALFVLTTIRDIDSGVYIPSLSIYTLIVLTVADIFLFVFFLHYITESIKYSTIIKRVHEETARSIRSNNKHHQDASHSKDFSSVESVLSPCSDVYQGFENHRLVRICNEEDIVLNILPKTGSYILKDSPFIEIKSNKKIDKEVVDKVTSCFNFSRHEKISTDYKYGFRQLTEIALKALSPGLNDPGTAIEALRSLFDLLRIRIQHSPEESCFDADGQERIIAKKETPDDIFHTNILPVWDYGKNDRSIINEFLHLLPVFMNLHPLPAAQKLYHEVSMQEPGKND